LRGYGICLAHLAGRPFLRRRRCGGGPEAPFPAWPNRVEVPPTRY